MRFCETDARTSVEVRVGKFCVWPHGYTRVQPAKSLRNRNEVESHSISRAYVRELHFWEVNESHCRGAALNTRGRVCIDITVLSRLRQRSILTDRQTLVVQMCSS